MFNILMLISVIAGISMQQISQKAYLAKNQAGVFTFSSISAFCAALFFVATSGGKLNFTVELYSYSFSFAAVYAASIAGLFLAIKYGPLSLSALLISYSLIIPVLYGIIVLNEEVDIFLIAGVFFLLVSLALVNAVKKGDGKISVKWIVFILLGFIGNGLCTVVQKVQQQAFSGAYKSEFMIVALVMVAVGFGIAALISEKETFRQSLGATGLWCVLCGACNGAVNLFVMILTNCMNISVMFPLISVGGIIITFIVSRYVYREKLSAKQKLGALFGVLAVIALNI